MPQTISDTMTTWLNRIAIGDFPTAFATLTTRFKKRYADSLNNYQSDLVVRITSQLLSEARWRHYLPLVRNEDGTVIYSIIVNDHDNNDWTFIYTLKNEAGWKIDKGIIRKEPEGSIYI